MPLQPSPKPRSWRTRRIPAFITRHKVVSAVACVAAVAGILVAANAAAGPADNYCLLSVNDNEYGGSGVLAVPQANATQSVCNSVADSTQESTDAGTDDTGSMFVIYGDKPGYLSACQQENMRLFGMGGELPGWIVYSGVVGGVQAVSDGTACGASSNANPGRHPVQASAPTSASAPADTYTLVTATGSFGEAPTVKIPAENGTGPLFTKTLIQGTGTALTTSESLLANFVMYDWSDKTHKLISSTWSEGTPTLFAGKLLPGLEKALIGQKVGSRVLAVIPSADGFGSSGDSKIGVGGKDTVVFVIDMLQAISNTASVPGTQTYSGGGALPTVTPGAAGKPPTVTIPPVAPPTTSSATTLIKGTGPVVEKGQLIVVQYTGVIWRTGQVFDSTSSRGEPFSTAIGEGQVIKGWDDGLVGQTVGSRVMLVIPPADGYGSAGSSQAGIKGTDTLVFVIDILAAAGPS